MTQDEQKTPSRKGKDECLDNAVCCNAVDCQVLGHYHARPPLTEAQRRLKEKEKKEKKKEGKKKKRPNIPKFKRCYIALKNKDCGNLDHAHCFHAPADHWDARLLADADLKDEIEEKHNAPTKYQLKTQRAEKERRAERQFYLDLDAVQIDSPVPGELVRSSNVDLSAVVDLFGTAGSPEDFDVTFGTCGQATKQCFQASSLSAEEKVGFVTLNPSMGTTPLTGPGGAVADTPVAETSSARTNRPQDVTPDELMRLTQVQNLYRSDNFRDDSSEDSSDSSDDDEDDEDDEPGSDSGTDDDEGDEEGPEDEEKKIDEPLAETAKVKIFLAGADGASEKTLKGRLISLLGYLPGLDAIQVATDTEFTNLFTNTYEFHAANTLGLTSSKSRREAGQHKVYWQETPSAQVISQLQLLYSHFIEAPVDQFIAKQVMLDPKLNTASFVSEDGKISRTVETSSGHILSEVVKLYPGREIANSPSLMTNTRLHIVNMCILVAIMVARSRPTGQLDFRTRVSSPS